MTLPFSLNFCAQDTCVVDMSKNTLIDLIHIFLKLKRKNKRRPNGETIAGDAKGALTLTLIASRQT